MRCLFFSIALFLNSNPASGLELQSESKFGYFQQQQSTQKIKGIGGSGVIFDLQSPQGQVWGLGFRTLAHGAEDVKASQYRLGFGGFAFLDAWKAITSKLGVLYYKENNETRSRTKGIATQEARGEGLGVFLDLYRYINLYSNVDFGFGSTMLWTTGSFEREGNAPHLGNLRSGHQAFTQALSVSLKIAL